MPSTPAWPTHVAEERRSAVFDALLQVAWSNDTAHNHERLTHLLQSHASDAATGPLLAHAAQVDALCEGDDLEAIVARIAGLQTDDAWLQAAQKTLAAGAPGSARWRTNCSAAVPARTWPRSIA